MPSLVLEADSSQHSAVVDAMAGASFVIQGPPGTGKSQTIANIIAAALDADKTVLFMAEKSAALNVVSSRLKDRGLGPFLFEVHSDKVRKSDVLAALSERLALDAPQSPDDLKRKLAQRRAHRDKLARYVELMGQPVGRLDRPLYRLMWLVNRQSDDLSPRIPKPLLEGRVPHANGVDQQQLDGYRDHLDALARARQAIVSCGQSLSSHPWRGIGATNVFEGERIVACARETTSELQALTEMIESLRRGEIAVPGNTSELKAWAVAAKRVPSLDHEPQLMRLSLQAKGQVAKIADYIEHHLDVGRRLRSTIKNPDTAAPEAIGRFLEGCALVGVEPSIAAIKRENESARSTLAVFERIKGNLARVLDALAMPLPDTAADALALVTTVKLFCEAPQPVVEARTAGMYVEGSDRMIAAARHRAVSISARGRGLSRQFDIDRARHQYPAPVLYRAADSLQAANVVTQFAAEARRAKKLWRSLSREAAAPDRPARSQHLKAIAHHLTEEQAFAAELQHQALFGPDFGGVEADFDLFASAAALLRQAADVMASASPATDDVVRGKVVQANTHSIRRLKARLPADMLADLEQSLSSQVLANKSLQSLLDDARDRSLNLTNLLNQAEELLRPDAVLPREKNAKNEWTTAADLTEWRERNRVLIEGDRLRRVVGPSYELLLQNPVPLRAVIAAVEEVERASLPSTLLSELKSCTDPAEHARQVRVAAPAIEDRLSAIEEAWGRFSAAAQLTKEFQIAEDGADELTARHRRLSQLLADADGLSDWITYRLALDKVTATPAAVVGEVFDRLDHAEAELADMFEFCLVKSLIRQQLDAEGKDLSEATGTHLDNARSRFQELDKEILDLEAERIAAKTWQRQVPYGVDRGPRSSWTDRSLLENEAKKKKRHIPLRDLIRRAPQALRALKPVWLMSPLTAAQYLPRLDQFFDLVIIDEASQMKPADAIGGLARASQAIIVGDPMQLPPTTFFGASLDGGDGQDGAAAGQSSILDLADARLRQKRMLRWHYRSRHESLIAFSNRQFYDNKLVVFPTASDDPDLGIQLDYVGGRYVGGGTNPDEVRAIVEQARKLIERSPELSIGLVTTNVSQRELVSEELDRLASNDKLVADYRARWEDTLEPLFVKNLENVQGDERDVILISTVFGPDETGRVAQRFGPINSEAGHRRLNVLFTRAKRKIVLVTSLRSADVIASPTGHRGVQVLKDFLEYANTGRSCLASRRAEMPIAISRFMSPSGCDERAMRQCRRLASMAFGSTSACAIRVGRTASWQASSATARPIIRE